LKGLILGAGVGRRLRPHTNRLPKPLVPLHGRTTILDFTLRNLAAVGVVDVTVVAGHAAHVLAERAPALAARHGVTVAIRYNDRPDWNNAYSLWLARDVLAGGALLVNGDTLHPVEVEKLLLAQRGPDLLLAVDALGPLNGEAMKVTVAGERISRISKRIPVRRGYGEYIGVAVVEPAVAPALATALDRTWRRDPQRFYEDAFQVLIDGGADVRPAHLGAVEWVEVDDPTDLARARAIAGRW
jgi:choline kinase